MKRYGLEQFADMHVHMSDIDLDRCEKYLTLLADCGLTDITLQSLTYRALCYNLSVLYWKKNFKRARLSAYGMIHDHPGDIYRDIPYETQVRALLDMGCDGIKMMFAPDSRRRLGHGINDPRYDAMFAYLESCGVPLCIHVNDPEHMWVKRELTEYEKSRNWGYFHEGYLSKAEIYRETFERLDRNPGLRIVFAHFYFLSADMKEAARVLDTYPNVSFDLTPGVEMYPNFSERIEAWREFFIRYADRIVFGTDCNDTKSFNAEIIEMVHTALTHDHTEFVTPCYGNRVIRGLDLPQEVVERICWKNYKRILPSIRPVNTELLLAAAARLYDDLAGRDSDFCRESAAWAKACFEAKAER